jgi:predicted glycogen debranching enzyme
MAAYRGENEFFKMDHDWLITAQAGMTWMDARVNGVCVTPRGGKACEINALWYAANRFMAEMAAMLDLPWDEKPASRIKRSFRRFWNEDAGCLHDTIDPVDSSVRPNQVIAAAFSNDLIGQKRRDQILSLAEDCLLTPYGLRTLAPNEPGYIGRYEGGPVERDKAYHQGTVWPWLIGPYVSARRNAGTAGGRLAEVLSPLIADDRAGICTISEVYDGDVPHRPNGCISQAWSVGEVLRAWREDVEGVRPSSKR